MHSAGASFETLIRHGLLLAANVISRDNLNLGPTAISLAAAARLRRGLRAMHAYLRRVVILMALQFEPHLTLDNRPLPRRSDTRKFRRPAPSIPILRNDRPRNDRLFESPFTAPGNAATIIDPAPLISHFRTLKKLLAAPEDRARRLAFHLARRKTGLILPPDLYSALIRNRDGTEVSALYRVMARDIQARSRERPPPIGPRPRPPPRIRRL